jgi:transcription antitermination factor NusG
MNALKLNENHLDESEPRWFAVYTKYKREKLVEKRLHEQGIQAYLPIQRLTRKYERKVKTVELPLISCYIFTRITKKNYTPVLNTADVLQFVKFSQNLIAIPDREIQLLRRVVGEGIDVDIEPKTFYPGDEVEIATGNLTGIRGILLEKDKKKNFIIELNSIGYSLRISVEPALLRRVNEAQSV